MFARFFVLFLFCIRLVGAAEVYTGLDGVVPPEWHPAHGYFLRTSVFLQNARVNGCFGSAEAVRKVKIHLTKVREEWRQSTFESFRAGEHLRHTDNSLSYPLEPIAAFIQWCYPSPARTTLGANVNCNDPLGIWAKDVQSLDPTLKKHALALMGRMIRLIDHLYAAPVLNDEAENHFSAQLRSLFNSEHESRIDAFAKHVLTLKSRMIGLIDLLDAAPAPAAEQVQRLENVATNISDLSAQIESQLNSAYKFQRRLDAFGEIIFEAVKADRFNPVFRKLYPAGIVRHTLLAYLTNILSSQADIVTVFKCAGMIDEAFEPAPAEPLTKASYQAFAASLETFGRTFSMSEVVRYLIGYDIYENLIPKISETKRSVVNIDHHHFEFADCGEVALLNFFIAWLWEGGALHPEYLSHLDAYPHIQSIKAHFEKYDTLALLDTPQAHNDWAHIVANKNLGQGTKPFQRVRYNRGGLAELSGATPSLLNLFDVFFTSTDNQTPTFIRGWETEDISSDADKALVLDKWKAICNLLKHPTSEKSIVVETFDLKGIGKESEVEFLVNGCKKFSYQALNGHFSIKRETTNSNIAKGKLHHRLPRELDGPHVFFSGYSFALFGHEYFNNQSRSFLNDPSSLLANLTTAIFFRLQDTLSHGLLDDPAAISNTLWRSFQFSNLGSATELVRWMLSSQAGKDFMMTLYLPHAFTHKFGFNAALVKELKTRKVFDAFLLKMRKGAHPKKWQFAAFYGDDKAFKTLTGSHTEEAQKVLKSPVQDEMHPLCVAVGSGHLNSVQIITQNGKSSHWKQPTVESLFDRPLVRALLDTRSREVMTFIIKHYPTVFKPDKDEIMPKQMVQARAKTPEIFDDLGSLFGLTGADLLAWHNPLINAETTTLNEALCSNASVARHLLTQYPNFPLLQ